MCFPRISGITSLAAAILLLIAPVERLAGYALTGMSWPASSSIVMQLELGPTTVALQDGLGTWNASAADALALWNQQMVSVQFSSVNDSNATKASGDGYNSVFFADNVFG